MVDNRKKRILGIVIITFIIIVVFMISLAIAHNINKSKSEDSKGTGTPEVFNDHISGETIYTSKNVGLKDGGIAFVGLDILLREGTSSEVLDGIKKLFYDIKDQYKIERVTVYKNSLRQDTKDNKTHTVKLAINQGEKDVYLKFINVTYLKYELHLYSDPNMTQEIKQFSQQ